MVPHMSFDQSIDLKGKYEYVSTCSAVLSRELWEKIGNRLKQY